MGKLMVQNQDEMIKAGRLATPYNGVMDCFRRTIADEGMTALWRGNTANVIRYFPTQALNLASGGAAGAVSLFFVYSLDYARTRLANDAKSAKKGAVGGGERQFNGLIDVYKKTMATDGVAGLYRGFVISCVGIIVCRGCYFGFFDSLKPIILTGSMADNFFLNFALGYAVTVAAGLASYPLDTIRRRMMMTSGEAVKYTSSLQCARVIMANEGTKSFFKGAGANILRGVAGAGVLAGFDKLKAFYIKARTGV